MRRRYPFLLLILLGQCVDGSMPGLMTPTKAHRLTIASTPVTLDSTRPDRRRVGALTLLGAWHLTSADRSFGGFSALGVDGNRVTMLGDGGTIVRFRLGRFGTAADADMVPAPGGCGKVTRKTDNDTESLAHDGARENWWIGYEYRNAICRTNATFTQGQRVAAPPAMAKWLRKRGPETMVRLADGRFLVIAEKSRNTGEDHPAILFDRDPTDPAAIATTIAYRAPTGFNPTEAAQLPDGRILILNRRFTIWSLFTCALVVIDPIAPAPLRLLKGREVARFEAPVLADNYEGLAVSVEGNRPIVWIISDDNFMRWQRTLLLKFALN